MVGLADAGGDDFLDLNAKEMRSGRKSRRSSPACPRRLSPRPPTDLRVARPRTRVDVVRIDRGKCRPMRSSRWRSRAFRKPGIIPSHRSPSLKVASIPLIRELSWREGSRSSCAGGHRRVLEPRPRTPDPTEPRLASGPYSPPIDRSRRRYRDERPQTRRGPSGSSCSIKESPMLKSLGA